MVTNFKKNKKGNQWKGILLHLAGIVILIVCGFLIFTDIKIWQKGKEYKAQVADLQRQVKGIEESNDKLRQGMKNSDNPQYIEKIAREELDLQQPGEKVVSFVVPKTEQDKKDDARKNLLQIWLSSSLDWVKSVF
ncbi:septum formation initiator family protein [Candidatus Parcubacteria bacterium]|nr:septum formation initiator family protein [Candidatus Parcubacteria bacterium]